MRRFDANSYLMIGKAMDLHDVARGRGRSEAAMARITVPNLTIGITSDMLYPAVPAAPDVADAEPHRPAVESYIEVDSPHGHDAFLINFEQVGEPIAKFLGRVG